jgi:drug/metabolite transporter (DMT)-like permease
MLLCGALLGAILFFARLGQTVANLYTTAGKNAFITTMYVVWVPLILWIVERKNPGARTILASCLAIVGLMLLSLRGELGVNFGDCLVLAASMGHAIHIITTSKIVKQFEPITLTAVQFWVGFVCAGASVWITKTPVDVSIISTWVAFKVLYLGLFGTAVGFLLQTLCIQYVPSNVAPIILSLQSVFGMTFSVFFGYDMLTFYIVAGCILMFSAILVIMIKKRPSGIKLLNNSP